MNHFNAAIADEGPLERSNRSNEQLAPAAPLEEIKFATTKVRSKFEKKVLPKKKKN